jgi:hypothetical protein
MKTSFIQSQADLHRQASTILTSIQVKLEILSELTEVREHYKVKIENELDKLYLQYHDVMKKIIEPVIREKEYIGVICHREDVVTVAEEIHY